MNQKLLNAANMIIESLLHYNVDLFYKWKFFRMKSKFIKNLKAREPFLKTTEDSKIIYDNYGDREQKEWESKSVRCLYNNQIVMLTIKEIKIHYLKYLYEEISPIRADNKPIRILEVGCGNCINLVDLKKTFGTFVELYGIDISKNRINVAKNYFGEKLSDVNLQPKSITEKTCWDDNYFDLVFSMHCLEQIPYKVEDALREMYRLTNKKLVLIEPVIEFGNPAQRLYLYVSDHNRILLRTIKNLAYHISRIEPLNIQSNPLNQSSIIVIGKGELNDVLRR